MHRLLILLIAFALTAAACGDGRDVAALEDELATLVDATEDVRGLEFFEEPNLVVVSIDELADRVRDQIDEEIDPDEMAVTEALFELLGLLDGSVDLTAAYTELYAEAVGGFYDDDTGEMVVAARDGLDPLTKTIVVHELVHALTDQHFGFAAKLDDFIEQERFEEASVVQALAEGDATYFQLVYMETLPTSEQVEAVQASLAADTSVADALPGWFSEDLTWPYDAGFRFVDRVISDLGVSGLNQAYTLLPTTTEHIIHPGTYFTRQPPRSIALPPHDIEGYEVFEEGSWGEWNLQLALLDGIDRGEALIAASGWGGDDYRVYRNGDSIVFAYAYLGDTPADAEEFADSLAASVRERMSVGAGISTASGTTFSPGGDYAVVIRNGSRVLFVAADDPVVGSQASSALRSVLADG